MALSSTAIRQAPLPLPPSGHRVAHRGPCHVTSRAALSPRRLRSGCPASSCPGALAPARPSGELVPAGPGWEQRGPQPASHRESSSARRVFSNCTSWSSFKYKVISFIHLFKSTPCALTLLWLWDHSEENEVCLPRQMLLVTLLSSLPPEETVALALGAHSGPGLPSGPAQTAVPPACLLLAHRPGEFRDGGPLPAQAPALCPSVPGLLILCVGLSSILPQPPPPPGVQGYHRPPL